MISTPICAKKLYLPSPNISHVDGATPKQSNSGIQKTYSIIGRSFMKVTENKLLLEKFEMLRAKLKSTKVDNFYKGKYVDEFAKLQTTVLSAFTSMKMELSTVEAKLSVRELAD